MQSDLFPNLSFTPLELDVIGAWMTADPFEPLDSLSRRAGRTAKGKDVSFENAARSVRDKLGISTLGATGHEEARRLIKAAAAGQSPFQKMRLDDLTEEESILIEFDEQKHREMVIDSCVVPHPVFAFEGLPEEKVEVIWDRSPIALDRALAIWKEKHRKGKVYTNRIRLAGYAPLQLDDFEYGKMQLWLSPMDWLDVESFSLDLPALKASGVDCGRLFERGGDSRLSARIPCPMCASVVLESGENDLQDRRLVVGLRSAERLYNPLTWSLSFEEQLSNDPRSKVNLPADKSPFDAACAGALEEFKAQLIRPSLQLLGIGFELPHYFAHALMVGQIEATASMIESKWMRAHGKEEHLMVRTVAIDLEQLAELFMRKVPFPDVAKGCGWHPTSRMRLYAYMAYRFGQDRVDRYMEALYERGPKKA